MAQPEMNRSQLMRQRRRMRRRPWKTA